MNRPVIIKFLSVLINILICLIAVALFLYMHNWFGQGDVKAFIFWTVPLSIGVAISGYQIVGLYQTANIFLKLFFILLSAILLAFGWVYFVYLFLGPWINSFSFPILYLWIVGNAVQLLFLQLLLPKPQKNNKVFEVILGLGLYFLILTGLFIAMYLFS